MKTVAFYSYKGGAGRSLTLANVATLMGCNLGHQIGMVDLDCEAAALHEIFSIDAGEANLLEFLLPRNRSLPEL